MVNTFNLELKNLTKLNEPIIITGIDGLAAYLKSGVSQFTFLPIE